MISTLPELAGRIQLKGLLGRGGMGEVHRAWDAGLERPVAVKLVRGADASEEERLLLEARLQARVDHPNVVKVLEVGLLEGRPCIVLQLVEGRTLARRAPELPLEARVELVRQAALGIHAAHRQGLVHRDVKPENILVEGEAEGLRALVTDFGLARDEEGGLTRSGLPAGTLVYMAPEQVLPGPPVDLRADVYGLGATLYAAAALEPPFRDSGDPDAAALLTRILEEDPRPLGDLRTAPGLSVRDLGVVAAKALEKRPESRYPSAEAFAEDLGRWVQGRPIQACAPGAAERLARWARRHRGAVRVLAAALLVAALGLGYAARAALRSRAALAQAARLGAAAESIELRLRMARLAPAHDLRPLKGELLAEIRALEAQEKGPAPGAAAYAAGRGYLALVRLDEARAALRRARALGYGGRELEEAEGLVLGELYFRQLPQAELMGPGPAREAKLAALQAEFRDPALRALRAYGTGPRAAYLTAVASLLEGRLDEVPARARAALAQDPTFYEARLVEAKARFRAMELAQEQGRHAEAAAVVPALEALLAGLSEEARSDTRVPRLRAELAITAGRADRDLDRDPAPRYREAARHLAAAEALDAEDPDVWVQWTFLEGRWGLVEDDAGRRTEALAHYEAQARAADRATALAPDLLEPWERQAYAHYTLAALKSDLGQDPTGDLAAGRRAVARALVLNPASGVAHYHGLILANTAAQWALAHRRDPEPDIQEALAHAAAAWTLRQDDPTHITSAEADAHVLRSQALMEAGRDPEPDLARAAALAEEGARLRPDNTGSVSSRTYALVCWARARLDMGRDVGDILARGLASARDAAARWSRDAIIVAQEAEALSTEARRQVEGGLPGAARALKEARTAVDAVAARLPVPDLWEEQGRLALLEGAPDRARAAFLKIRKARGPEDPVASCGLAAAALLAPPARRVRAAREGLKELAVALADGRAPEAAYLQVRLLAAAGDLPAARRALEAAWARWGAYREGFLARAAARDAQGR